MKLEPGQPLGAYEIVRFIAAGGRGAVYEARHIELGRRVAIKVMSEDLQDDRTARARFRREARAASALQHPHICAVYDFFSDEELSYLVLEYVEGETLRARLRRERLAIDEVAEIGATLADALGQAHEHGLIHRDLTPTNVMLTHEGPKILDFGATRRALTGITDPQRKPPQSGFSETLTKEGDLVGTLPYMSPEQLDGGEIDHRSDIHALGLILYEMTTGRAPFDRSTRGAVAAAIIGSDVVPVEKVRRDTPRRLARVIEKCIEKRPEHRWQNARDLGTELRWAAREAGEESVAEPKHRDFLRLNRWALIGLTGAASAVVLTVALLMRPDRLPPSTGSLSVDLLPPPGVQFTEGTGALSPDGNRFAFSGTDSDGQIALWIRELRHGTTELVQGSDGALKPFWSPDGASLAYFAGAELRVVDLASGRTRSLATVSPDSRGGSWGSAGTIIYAPDLNGPLQAVGVDGTHRQTVTTVDSIRSETGHMWPSFLPDGRRFVVFVSSPDREVEGLYLGSVDEGLIRRLVAADANGVYSAGHLIYERGGALLAQPLGGEVEPSGLPQLLLPDVAVNFQRRALFSVSPMGPLAYSSSDRGAMAQLELLDRLGRTSRVVGPLRHQRNPDVSDNGRFVAIETYDRARSHIWVTDLQSGRSRRVTDPSLQAALPIWSPNGTTLAFASADDGASSIYTVDIDRAEPAKLVFRSPGIKILDDWTPDGQSILYAHRGPRQTYDVMRLDLMPPSGTPVPLPIFGSPSEEIAAKMSPSGERIAYVSDESGAYEIYVETFPRSGPRCLVSVGSGFQPTWGDSDGTLYYLAGNGDLMAVEIDALSPCDVSEVVRLFGSPIANPSQSRTHFAYVPGSGLFLFVSPGPEVSRTGIGIVTDWRRLPTGPLP